MTALARLVFPALRWRNGSFAHERARIDRALAAGVGGFILFESLVVETEDGEKIGKWAWKPLGFILLANFAFGVLLGGLPSLHVPAMGMIVAIIALTFIAALAGDEFNWKEIAVLSVVLAIGSYAAFVWLLKLQFPVWPSFITG